MRISRAFLALALVTMVTPLTVAAQAPEGWRPAAVAGANAVVIRGQTQAIHLYPARGASLNRKILFLPGDGGWKGWAVTIGETMATWGYDVYGLDTKTYLDGFTRAQPLTERDIAHDLHQIAGWMTNQSRETVTLVGWSEGAGLCVLGAAADANKGIFAGLVTIGLSNENVLGWHWQDNLMSLVKKPKEPTFQAAEYIGKITPLPLLMIQSSRDQYVSMNEAKALFAQAQDPKRFIVVDGENHRFDGNQDEFFRTLREGLRGTRLAQP